MGEQKILNEWERTFWTSMVIAMMANYEGANPLGDLNIAIATADRAVEALYERVYGTKKL